MDPSANVVAPTEVVVTVTPLVSAPLTPLVSAPLTPIPEVVVPEVVVPEVVVPVVVVPEVVVPEVVVVVPTTLDKDVEALFKVITTDSGFLTRVKEAVDRIMKDGKVDQYDIPEIVFIISDTVNSLPSFQVTSEVLPVLIKMLYNFIVDTYKLVPDDKKAEIERLVDSSLRLLMMQPKVKEELNRCAGFFSFLLCK